MSIPLDNLYCFIENIAEEINDNIIIYHFYPHGSKNIKHLQELRYLSWKERTLSIPIYCHDQEPLNYNLCQNVAHDNNFTNILKSISMYTDRNLSYKPTIYSKVCLLHSEKRSNELITYQNNQCIGVYYWCHALIALDWFRFAQHTQQKKNITKKFLIYNRAWSGTREYRLKFAEYLIRLGLDTDCKMSINPIEPELDIHYDQHKFFNPAWRPTSVLENHFPVSAAHSHCSADFDLHDYESTEIEIILETLFDDSRLQLTEKSLRPISCGQPFILASTHGSLEYLRSYGFKTFGHIWDEQYDLVEDPQERLVRIADLMKQIANWAPWVRERKMIEAQAIADYNKKHFFSQEFFDQVILELKNNLTIALDEAVQKKDFTPFIERWEKLLTYKEIQIFLESASDLRYPTLTQINEVLKITKNLQNGF